MSNHNATNNRVIFNVGILNLDEPTRYVYPRHVLEKAISKANWSVPLCFGDDIKSLNIVDGIPLEHIVGIASDLGIVGNQLRCNLTILDTPIGNVLETLLTDEVKVKYKIFGNGAVTRTVTDEMVVGDDYSLWGVAIYDNIEN